jgi:hypothetical protein
MVRLLTGSFVLILICTFIIGLTLAIDAYPRTAGYVAFVVVFGLWAYFIGAGLVD